VQGVVDSGAVTNIMTATDTSSVAASYATLVPNTSAPRRDRRARAIAPIIIAMGTPSPEFPIQCSYQADSDVSRGFTIYGYYLSPYRDLGDLDEQRNSDRAPMDNTWTTMLIPLRPASHASKRLCGGDPAA
jgi:hypothetical protein